MHLLKMAERFVETARGAGDRDDPWGREHALQNVCYALELGLKAYLQATGWSDDRCRIEIRHDLVKALAAAEQAGLSAPPSDLAQALKAVSVHYTRHEIGSYVRNEGRQVDVGQIVDETALFLRSARLALGKPNRARPPATGKRVPLVDRSGCD